jgi:hypothetical protein
MNALPVLLTSMVFIATKTVPVTVIRMNVMTVMVYVLMDVRKDTGGQCVRIYAQQIAIIWSA